MTAAWTSDCSTTIDPLKQRQCATNADGEKRSYETFTAAPSSRTAGLDVTHTANLHSTTKRPCHHPTILRRLQASKIEPGAGAVDTTRSVDDRLTRPPPIPGPSQNPLLSLHHPRYGLPGSLVTNLAALGINSIYPWQSSCLLGRGLLEGERNLVYTAPTGGGKSFVADVLMVKHVIEHPSRKAILVLPYVALVQEKLTWLRKVVEGVPKTADTLNSCGSQIPAWRAPHLDSVRVVGFYGNSKARLKWTDFDVAVCTIEKVSPNEGEISGIDH